MQTASAEHLQAFKDSEIKRLTEEGWKQKISAEHLRTTIPRLEDLIKKAQTETEPIQKELDGLDKNDHRKENRLKIKELEKKIGNANSGIAFCETKIGEIKKQIAHLDEQSQAQLKRAAFMEENFPACLDYKEPEEVVTPTADSGVVAG